MSPNEIVAQEEEIEENKVPPGYETYDEEGVKYHKLTTDMNYKHEYIPIAVVAFALLHAGALYGLYLMLTFQVTLKTFIFGLTYGMLSSAGVVLGAHRGFSHNAFKFILPAHIFIIILQTISGQYHIHWWVRDHRLHHKFVDTDADPYNAKRGFWFSHIGWMMTRKHPLVKEKGKLIDVSDLEADKWIMLQKKYFIPLFLIFSVAIPIAVPVYFFGESFWTAFFTSFMYRYVHVLNSTWAINSFAHMLGSKTFDTRITATQSLFADHLTFGDGWHNFHHVFPQHHALSEFGYGGGFSTRFLYLMEWLGLAYDLKSAPRHVIYNHYKKYGDGSIPDDEFKVKSN